MKGGTCRRSLKVINVLVERTSNDLLDGWVGGDGRLGSGEPFKVLLGGGVDSTQMEKTRGGWVVVEMGNKTGSKLVEDEMGEAQSWRRDGGLVESDGEVCDA
jgi:hypothetical protein